MSRFPRLEVAAVHMRKLLLRALDRYPVEEGLSFLLIRLEKLIIRFEY